MSDVSRPAKPEAADHRLDLTRTLKRLSMPTAHADRDDETSFGTALLLCTDAASRKWACRWLTQSRFQAQLPPDPQHAVAIARDIRPAVIIVESALVDYSGTRLYQALLDAADLEMPVIVLCSGSKDLSDIMQAGPYDVARKPYEWPLIALRAQHAVQHNVLQSRYENSRESLKQALDLADAARQRLRSRESFEPVTGLPNKRKFMELLGRGMTAVDRDGTNLAVVVIGFNRFRLVVEALGQDRADLMQTEIGRILTECLSASGSPGAGVRGLRTAAAASIDQFRFALMMTVSASAEELAGLREILLERLSRPIQVEGQMISLSACLGVALYPQDADDVDSLLQRADNAMRDAQSRGGGFKYYCAETDAAAARKLRLEHMLHEALDRNELSLAYQPITEVSRGRVTAAEALLRWRQADGSYISPDEFVPVAEETGLMNRIGEFVVEEACRQLIAWRKGGIPMPRMCVNVSRVQLMSGDFVPAVRRILDKLDFDPSGLELELSERGVLSGDYDVINQLHELKNLGIRLSIDDFGTGDSAISYLKALPVDVLKIDRSYIAGLTDNEKDAAIVSAMVALGQRLGLVVVAEGVETTEQLAILQKLGCDAFQGFLISQPVPGNTFVSLLQKPKPGAA